MNVNVLNTFDPPGGPPTAVAYNNCANGLFDSTICISCVLNVNSYLPDQRTTNSTSVDPTKPKLIDCGTDGQGLKGKCMEVNPGNFACVLQVGYSCDTTGSDYPNQ